MDPTGQRERRGSLAPGPRVTSRRREAKSRAAGRRRKTPCDAARMPGRLTKTNREQKGRPRPPAPRARRVRALRQRLRAPGEEALDQRVRSSRKEVRRDPLAAPSRLRQNQASQLRRRLRVPLLLSRTTRQVVDSFCLEHLPGVEQEEEGLRPNLDEDRAEGEGDVPRNGGTKAPLTRAESAPRSRRGPGRCNGLGRSVGWRPRPRAGRQSSPDGPVLLGPHWRRYAQVNRGREASPSIRISQRPPKPSTSGRVLIAAPQPWVLAS